MKYNKLIGGMLVIFHGYYFLETFFWQGPIMPAWRFLLGVFGSLLGVVFGFYLVFNSGSQT